MVDLNDVEREARNPDEPWYECDEDYGCACNDEGVGSSWEWDADQDCYVCYSCGCSQ